MRRDLRLLTTLGLAGAVAALSLACDTAPALPPPDFRMKAAEAVQTRFDARAARLETRKVRDLYEVKVWMPDPAAKEKVKAICWFNEQRQLVMVRYPD